MFYTLKFSLTIILSCVRHVVWQISSRYADVLDQSNSSPLVTWTWFWACENEKKKYPWASFRPCRNYRIAPNPFVPFREEYWRRWGRRRRCLATGNVALWICIFSSFEWVLKISLTPRTGAYLLCTLYNRLPYALMLQPGNTDNTWSNAVTHFLQPLESIDQITGILDQWPEKFPWVIFQKTKLETHLIFSSNVLIVNRARVDLFWSLNKFIM